MPTFFFKHLQISNELLGLGDGIDSDVKDRLCLDSLVLDVWNPLYPISVNQFSWQVCVKMTDGW